MRRHENLIPLSREHHQMLVVAQVLRNDVAPYKGMPTDFDQKKAYLLDDKSPLILKNLNFHRKSFYPDLRKHSDKFEEIVEQLMELEDVIIAHLMKANSIDEEAIQEIAMTLQTIVRKRERILYEKVQIELEDWLDLKTLHA